MIVKLLGSVYNDEGDDLTNMRNLTWHWTSSDVEPSSFVGFRLAQTQQVTENTEGNDGR